MLSPLSRQKNTSNWTIVSERITQSKLYQEQNILYVAPFFKINGKELGLSNYFYVKLKDGNDFKLLEKMAVENRVEIVGHDVYMPKWYLLSCDKLSKGNALDLANLFYESGQFEEAQPDLMEDNLASCTNDLLFNEQWHLNNTGQSGGTSGNDISICNAWDITMGCADITVAVLDNGLEFNHPDFNNISNVSFDTETGTSPSVIRGNHGVAVAGIIGATANNGIGVAGVAPNAQLMSISNSLAATPASRQIRASGINFAWQNGADIINNSWGSTVVYPIIDDAILNAVNFGRNGLGTIVVFASGNDNSSSISYPSNNSNTISVGAINRQGNRANFSNYGTGLDLVAPGVDIRTTDRQGANGYSVNDYTVVPGTSFAAPQVAGVAALILSVNPGLTQQQVRNIIESTADKVGSYSYTMNAGEQTGLTWNNQMGYGRLNAQAAVQAALPTISGPSLVCTTNSTFSLSYVPPGTTVTWSASSNLNISTSNNQQAAITAINGMVGGEPWPVVNNGWLEANIISDCGETPVRKYFWVGRPPTPTADVDRQPIFYNLSLDGVPSEICVSPMSQTGDFYAGGVAGFGHSFVNHWETDAGSIYGNSSPTEYSAVTVNLNNHGYRYIRVRAENACGYSAWVTRYFDLVYEPNGCGPGGGGIGFAMQYSPNPVAGILTVDITPTEKAETQSNEFLVTLNNKYGKVVYANKSTEVCHSIDMQSLENGLYRLVVEKDGEQHIAKIYKE